MISFWISVVPPKHYRTSGGRKEEPRNARTRAEAGSPHALYPMADVVYPTDPGTLDAGSMPGRPSSSRRGPSGDGSRTKP